MHMLICEERAPINMYVHFYMGTKRLEIKGFTLLKMGKNFTLFIMLIIKMERRYFMLKTTNYSLDYKCHILFKAW